MLIAVYKCESDRGMTELLYNGDSGESFEIIELPLGALVIYKSPHLIEVATEDLPKGVELVWQECFK